MKNLRENSTLLPDKSHSKPRDKESTPEHNKGCIYNPIVNIMLTGG